MNLRRKTADMLGSLHRPIGAWMLAVGALLLAPGLSGSARAGDCLPDADGDGHPLFRNLIVGSGPAQSGMLTESVAFGDLNGDGILDLVTGNSNGHSYEFPSVLVEFGTGDGTFVSQVRYDIQFTSGWQAAPLLVVIGDLDGDGDQDLAVEGNGSFPGDLQFAYVAILLNNGDGTFNVQPATYTIGEGGSGLTVGDLDGDGDLDLIATVRNCLGSGPFGFEENVFVLLNNGDATFAAPVPYMADPGHPGATSIVLGDLDADGDQDLVVGRNDCQGVGGRNGFAVLLNNGDGTFASPLVYLHAGGNSVALGDLDEDGSLDLVLTRIDPNDNFDLVYIFLNPGDGVFPPAGVSYTTGRDPRGVVLADITGDGHLDVAVAISKDPRVSAGVALVLDDISVLAGNGDGTLADEVRWGWGARRWAWDLAVADLDGDGDLDLGVTNRWDSNVSILLNDGVGDFETDQYQLDGEMPTSVVVADLDLDGDLDVVVGNTFTDNVSVLLNNGGGLFAAAVNYPGGGIGTNLVFSGSFVSAADLNGDGYPDIVVTGSNTNSVDVLLNQGDGTFGPPQTHSVLGPNPRPVVLDDMDGDGDLDLVVLLYNPSGYYGVVILFNDGNAGFSAVHVTPPFAVSPHPGMGLATGDFDGDGFPDLAVANKIAVTLYLNSGDGTTFNEAGVLYTAPDIAHNAVGVPVAADLDGDGDVDLAVATFTSLRNDAGDIVTDVIVLLNNGDGTFAAPVFYYKIGCSENPLPGIEASDLDGDGDLDLAISTWCEKKVSVLLNNGDGTFSDSFGYGAARPAGLAIGDLNGDGAPDIVTVDVHVFEDRSQNTVSILWNRSCAFVPEGCSPADVTTQGAGVGDPGFGVPDGIISGSDINYYVNLWVALDLEADLTTQGAASGDPLFGVPDGVVTGSDINFYVNLWVAGCP